MQGFSVLFRALPLYRDGFQVLIPAVEGMGHRARREQQRRKRPRCVGGHVEIYPISGPAGVGKKKSGFSVGRASEMLMPDTIGRKSKFRLPIPTR